MIPYLPDLMCALMQGAIGAGILGSCAWASNIWPGLDTWRSAALSRLLWWGLPFGLIGLLNDVTLDHACYLGGAAWLGAFIPHTEMPDIRTHSSAMLTDVAIVVLRVVGLLALPAGVFWVCGAWWVGMLAATLAVVPCLLAGMVLPGSLPGLRTSRQIAGALFGASTGFWVALAILVPDPLLDLLL